MLKKQKLELTWIGKDNRSKLEPRILLEDPEKSYHAAHRVTENDIFDNRLIFGDNLLVLKALEAEFVDKARCVFVDLTYNIGPRFRQRVEAIVEVFSTMREDLDKERKAIMAQWTKREKQIERVMGATVGMYGDLQGIAGKSLQEIEGLSFSVLEDSASL